MKKRNSFLFVLGMAALFALLLAASTTAATGGSTTAAAAPATDVAGRFPAGPIETRSGEALSRLSPDLRRLAVAPDGREVMVTALLAAGAPAEPVQRLMERSAVSKPVGGVRWVTGVVKTGVLAKLAGSDGLIGVISTETFRPATAARPDEVRGTATPPSAAELREALATGGRAAVGQLLRDYRPAPAPRRSLPAETASTAAGRSVKTADIHNTAAAYADGYTGDGVVVAVVDTGVDFGNPDLQGTQARLEGGPYDGWPFAYDTISGIRYALDGLAYGPDNWSDMFGETGYVHTLPVEDVECDGGVCGADLIIDYGSLSGWDWVPVELPFTWPDSSKSGNYYYSVHPDPYLVFMAAGFNLGLGYGADFVPPALILSDEGTPGVYDTVYVDLDFDQDLTGEMPMRRGAELAGVDLFDAAGNPGGDGVWDLSAGMLAWIADGVNPPPGVGSLYENVPVPAAGRLLSFIGDTESHGTNVAGLIVGQSRITDPYWLGPTNPLYAGAEQVGGVGGPVAAGMAPGARVAAIQNGSLIPTDAWTLSMIGFDGIPQSGDEAQLVNNSWSFDEEVTPGGWDFTARYGQYLNLTVAPTTTLLVGTGNAGAGYGTAASPAGSSTFISVGVGTSFGSLTFFEPVTPEQFTYGAIIPWSGRGPGAQESADPELICVGAFGTALSPLNTSAQYDEEDRLIVSGEGAYGGFGDASMAPPVCAGVAALAYEAYRARTGEWPTFEEARELLMAGATDLGYDGLAQGAGNANAGRSVDIAAGAAVWATPVQWLVGDYRGEEFPAYVNVALAGQSYQTAITVENPTGAAVNVNLTDSALLEVHEATFEVTLTAESWADHAGQPTWLNDITALIDQYDPDMMIAQARVPLREFDWDGDYFADVFVDLYLYDWTDRNNDGNLWADDDGNGLVGPDEIDFDGGITEYNLINFDFITSNNHQVSAGRDALSRRHDGVFLGLIGPWNDEQDVTVSISLRFYKKADWDWLSLSPGSVNVPAGSSAAATATLDIPADTRPGLYQGAVEYLGQVIPVVVQVAAQGPNFDFGAATLDEPRDARPYDNSHVYGAVDWSGGLLSGDWRHYFYDVAGGTAGPGKTIIVDTRWPGDASDDALSDVDTHIYGAAEEYFAGAFPEIFGPNGIEQIGASVDTRRGGGAWVFETATGGPREVVSGPVSDGLGFIRLRNVLSAGEAFADAVVGAAYLVEVTPHSVALAAERVPDSSPLMASAEGTVTFTSTRRIEEGLGALAFGVGRARTYVNQVVIQDDPGELCTTGFVMPVRIAEGGGALEVLTTSDRPGLDIDLILMADDGDEVFDCEDDEILGLSFTFTAEESISAGRLPAGIYWVVVHGWDVPGGQSTFDLTIRIMDGRDLTIVDLPAGPVEVDTPVSFQVELLMNYVPGTHEAVLYLGPKDAPMALAVPVEVTVPPAADAFRAFWPVVGGG